MATPFSAKKQTGLMLMGLLPLLLFGLGVFTSVLLVHLHLDEILPWIVGSVLGMVGILIGYFLFNYMTKHPFIDVLEGKGALVLTLDSTGNIQPFLCSVDSPYINSKMGDKQIKTTYDRSILFDLKTPINAIMSKLSGSDAKNLLNTNEEIKNDFLILKYDKNKQSETTFGFGGNMPLFIYNKNLDAFVTKEALGEMEITGITKHAILHFKKSAEETTSYIRDFARYVNELMKPKPNFWQKLLENKGLLIGIAIIFLIIIAALFIMPLLGNFAPSLPSLPSAPTIHTQTPIVGK